ncbi:MAG: carboxypeptidase M32 [Chloroflexi bacterium]|nr:carboxypeptidase M32 [Chloroflexota bacterium]
MNPQQAYDELVQRSKELFTVQSISALTGWDQQVNMPPKGVTHRAEMLAYLAQLIHEKATDPRLGELLSTAEQGRWEVGPAANLREWRRAYDQEIRLPTELVRRRAELTAKGNQIWQEARANNDFAAFAPALDDLIALSREMADHLGWQAERYDALLDLYEPGLTTAQCDTLFSELRQAIVPLLQKIVASPIQADPHLFRGADLPIEGQRELGVMITRALGFDYEAGRLDVSTHPFTSGTCAQDIRLTTRYDPQQPFQSLMGTIHEAGHGMYDQGIALEHEGTPLGATVSLGIHESQSRFFENNIGRNSAFWSYWFPRFRQTFVGITDHVGFDDFYLRLNHVTPSLIRVEADEVTYGLHIMVRFEIERDLFRGAIRPADLPAVWNAKYQEHLGIVPPTDREGVLQDIHWSWAYFGYFPTYALGSVYAAQLEAALRRDVSDLDDQLAAGEFAAPLKWMRERIHRPGSLYLPADLIEHATGKRPTADDYIAYVTRKYGELYQI